MSSPTHSQVLSRLSLLVPSVVLMCFPLTVRAELEVEWIDPNTIRVYGYGYAPGETVVVTNWLGCCTNCTLITPAELTAGMNEIIENCDDIISLTANIVSSAGDLQSLTQAEQEDISTFRRFGGNDANSSPTSSEFILFTNYVYSFQNKQTMLDRNYAGVVSNSGAYRRHFIAYNDGIYDYAQNHVLGYFNTVYDTTRSIISDASDSNYIASQVKGIANRYIDLSECPCGEDGGGGGGDGSGCAWTAEQIRELLGYVDHIDQDQHKRFYQLNAMSNNVENIDKRMDSYAKLVSGVLYQDGTIELGDGESWTNVYFSGESENYHYDKSNILQRIELILFGMAHSTTNFTLDASSVTNELDDAAANNVTNQFNEFSSDSTNNFLSAKSKLEAKVNSIKSISAMFVFWGTAGSDSPFTLGYVPNLDGSEGGQYIEVGNGFLGTEVSRFRQLCRYGFQLIWATSFLFLIWLFYVRLFKYVVIFLKYAFEWINEAFAS